MVSDPVDRRNDLVVGDQVEQPIGIEVGDADRPAPGLRVALFQNAPRRIVVGNRRVLNEEPVNWMQGIECLEGCGASIGDIEENCCPCPLEEPEENLRVRYEIILKRREEAYKRVEEAKAAARYMDDKVAHYEAVLAGLEPDDTNPRHWTSENRPQHGARYV